MAPQAVSEVRASAEAENAVAQLHVSAEHLHLATFDCQGCSQLRREIRVQYVPLITIIGGDLVLHTELQPILLHPRCVILPLLHIHAVIEEVARLSPGNPPRRIHHPAHKPAM